MIESFAKSNLTTKPDAPSIIQALKDRIRKQKVTDSGAYELLTSLKPVVSEDDAVALSELLNMEEVYRDTDRSFRSELLEMLGEIGDKSTLEALCAIYPRFGKIKYPCLGCGWIDKEKADREDIDEALCRIKTRFL